MCETCGCDTSAEVHAHNLQTGGILALQSARTSNGGTHVHEHVRPDGTRFVHAHGHDGHQHGHADAAPGGVPAVHPIEQRILAKNEAIAERNRGWLADRKVLLLNLMGAPGAGKTALLERTIRVLGGVPPISVIEGDQATSNDGERIRAAGAPVVQVNTGTGCHLDATMVAGGLAELRPASESVVVVENVGNLVCPALFDLGERLRVVVFSVTEGEDKPLKYPHMFRVADLVVLNKIDLLPHIDFDVTRAEANARLVNPDVALLRFSARTGDGLELWCRWLRHATHGPQTLRL
jgi:hydrogenase nickel incorporation protein HypB